MTNFVKPILARIKMRPKFLDAAAILFGLLFSWVVKNRLSALLFSGKSFSGRSFFSQLVIFVGFTLFFTLLVYLVAFVLQLNKRMAQYFETVDQGIALFFDKMRTNGKFRVVVSLGILGLGIALIFLLNNVIPSINTTTWEFKAHDIVPSMSEVGMDFRWGIYRQARDLFVRRNIQEIWANGTNLNGYPPLATASGLLFLPFDEEKAYLIQVLLLILATLASLGIAADLFKKYVLSNLGLDTAISSLISGFIFFAVLFFTFSSYPFLFSIERGNNDIIALLFALLSLWVLLHFPKKLWTQVILLSIATNLKIYPAILFILLFKKHGKKSILPVLTTNFLLLFMFGPNNALAFVRTLTGMSGTANDMSWIGNHSSYSFISDLITNVYPAAQNLIVPLWVVLTLAPLILWGAAIISLFKGKLTPQTALYAFMVSVPLMDILPTISHDYRLVILNSMTALLIAFIIRNILLKPSLADYFQLFAVLIVMFLLGRSFAFFSQNIYYFFANKYLWVLSFEGLVVWNIFRSQRQISGLLKLETEPD